MADNLRSKWKTAGVGFGHAFRDLGKAFVRTGAVVVNKADEWAKDDPEENPEQPQQDQSQQ